MTQNDKRNAKISEICRILAGVCMSEHTTLYPEDIMTFINESRNSDVRELLALHMTLNEVDVTRSLKKAIECAEAWDVLKQKYNADMAIVLLREKIANSNAIIDARSKFANRMSDYEKADKERIQENAKTLEEEIAIWDWLTSLENGQYTDNLIACQTAYEIAEANAKREHMLSKIACDAVKKHVYYGTVVRFMNEMCKDDKERAFFLQEYSNAQWRDGRFN